MDLTFIVGTGRSGSTMLSRILGHHREVLSLSEFFALLIMRDGKVADVPTEPMDGREFWRLLAAPDAFIDAAVRDGLEIPELTYVHGEKTFTPRVGAPRLLHTLPAITDEPDELFARLGVEMTAWPRRSAVDQYRALFEWLARVLDRRVVIERTGSSLPYVSVLHQQFPEAGFVHLHRDGPDCALSMSKHAVFRLNALVGAARRAAHRRSREADGSRALRAEFAGVVSPPYDAERIRTFPIPLETFGEMWSSWVCQGVDGLMTVPARRWMSMSYEALLTDPGAELTRLAEFVGIQPSAEWIRTAGQAIDGQRAGGAAGLAPDVLARLRQACTPGRLAIERLAAWRTLPTA